MKVDELKYEILAQHHILRALLVNLGDVARKVAEGDASCEMVLRQGAHQLSTELLRHMADEERILEELARAGHAPSAEHLVDIHHNHAHQRQMLASFDTRVDSVQSTRRLGEFIEAMTQAVTLDMEHEEAALFGSSSVFPVQQPQPIARVA